MERGKGLNGGDRRRGDRDLHDPPPKKITTKKNTQKMPSNSTKAMKHTKAKSSPPPPCSAVCYATCALQAQGRGVAKAEEGRMGEGRNKTGMGRGVDLPVIVHAWPYARAERRERAQRGVSKVGEDNPEGGPRMTPATRGEKWPKGWDGRRCRM